MNVLRQDSLRYTSPLIPGSSNLISKAVRNSEASDRMNIPPYPSFASDTTVQNVDLENTDVSDVSARRVTRPDLAGMLFSWAAEKGCGAGACDEISGCDDAAFRSCVAARRPSPEDTLLYDALRTQLSDGTMALGDALRDPGSACTVESDKETPIFLATALIVL